MRTSTIGVVAASVAIAALALPAPAQAPGGWGGRRGGMTGGMFGAQGRMQNRDPLVSHAMELIYRPDVQTDLHLDVRQKSALTQYQSQSQQTMMQQMRQMFQNMRQQRGRDNAQDGQADRTAQRQQMREQMQNQRAEIENKIAAGLNDILRPDQAARLHQLDLQWRGVLSLADSQVAEEAQISQEHRTTIMSLVQEYRTKSGEARRQAFESLRSARQRNGGPDAGANTAPPNPQALFASIERADMAARKDGEEKALALLTDDEQASWKRIQGKPFVFRQGIQGR